MLFNAIPVPYTILNTRKLNDSKCWQATALQNAPTVGTWKIKANSATDTIDLGSPGPQWTLKRLKTPLETKMMLYPVMLRLISTTLVTSSAVIAVPSLALAGEMKYSVMALILLPHHIMLLNTLQGLGVLFPLGNIIPMLKHFGSGGRVCTLN
jgi:hypothetical protein